MLGPDFEVGVLGGGKCGVWGGGWGVGASGRHGYEGVKSASSLRTIITAL